MTSDQRNHLRHQIDQEKRRQLEAAKPKLKDRRQSVATRRASYRAYYQRNRERILAQRRAA